MLNNKKGQGLPITTIILIILGIVVLVVLIIGFTQGWGTLKGWFTGGAGTERYVSQCAVACSTGSVTGWCNIERVPAVGKTGDANYAAAQTCKDLATAQKVDACNPPITCPTG